MKFILTDELGRLCKWLRILGFDSRIEKDRRSLVIDSLKEERTILTRDSKMSRFTGIRVVKIESDFVEQQVAQLIKDLNLKIEKDRLFTRCVLCNECLEDTDRDSVKDRVPEYVFKTQDLFMACPKCGKIYWHGTHWALANKFLSGIEKNQN